MPEPQHSDDRQMLTEDLAAEHEALKRQMAELHRAKLRHKVRELEEHLERLRRSRKW